MRSALRANNYGEAMLAAAHRLGSVIAQGKGVQLDTEPRRRIRRETGGGFPWPIVVGLVVLLFLASSGGGGGLLSGMLLGQMMGRYSRGNHRSGGGFGGYDSGDSFGGFGGGDSGGGGASSDW